MPINDKVKQLYDALKEDGGDVGSEQEFSDWFFAKGDEGYQNRKYVYDTFKEAGADIGENYEEFRDWLGLHAVKHQPSVEEMYSEGSEYNLPSSAKMEQEKPGMWGKVKEGGSKILSSIFGGNKEQTPPAGSTGRTEAAQMPAKEQLITDADNYGNPAVPVKNVGEAAGIGAVVGNVIQKNTQPPFYEEEQRTDYTKPYYDNDNGFGEFAQQGIDRLRQGQEATDPTRYNGEQLQIPLYNQEAALRGDIQRIDADVMRKFNEELASNKQQAGEYMRNTPGNPFAPTGVNLMNAGREANKIADPSKAIESAIKYADEQTKDMPDEVRYQVIESLLGQMEEQLINERIPSGTAEYVFWRGFKDSDLGRIMSSVVDTNYEKYLDQVAASRYKAGFWENLGKGAVTLASDMWEYMLPAGAAGKAGKWAGGKISGRIMNDLIRRGVPKSQAARIAERLTANSVGKSILQHGASNAVTFGTAGAISGAVEGLTEPATVQGFDGKHSIESEKIKNDLGLYGDLHDEVAETIKQAEAKQYSAENLFGKIFERAAWGVGTGVATSFGAPLGEIIGHGRGVAGKILGDATRLGVNATAMTGVGALEQATTPGAQPLTFEDLLLSEANNLLTFGALEARGIYNRAKNYRNIQQFEKAYDITDADKAKMKDLGYGDMLDAVEQLTTGKTAGAQPAEKKPNIITRLVNGERVSEVKMEQPKEASGVEQVEPQNLKKGLQQLINDYNAGRISEEEARKWYGLVTGDYSQQLQPITGVSQRTDISPDGKVQHFVDYLDAQGRRVRTVEAKTEEEAKQLSDDYRQEAQLNQISALEDMVTDKDVQEHFAETVRRDFGGSSGSETEGTETISTGGVREKIDRLNDLRARKKLHEMGEGKALTAEEERMLEEGLSTYERDVANIFGREDQLQEALQKQAEGGDLLPYEESLIQSAQNIYRNHAGHSKAASDFAREFEKRNGMEEGTLSQILEKKDRSEAEQKAVDDYVTDLQDYLRPRTEQVEIEEAGNPATNATESMVDMSPGVEPPTETPAGGAMQTEVASEAYSKGQAAVQANDAAAMRNIGYEMQKADARMSKLFTDDEAKAISDAVESGDEDALAAVVQQHTEPAKLDAIEKLKEAHDAMRGVEDAINDSYIGNDEAIRAEIEPYQSEQGEIVPLKLSNGSSVYYVSGDLNNTYGTVMVAYTGEDGSVRHAQVPVKEITEAGTPMGIDDFVQLRAEDERNRSDERYEGIISGTELRKGSQVELTMDNSTGMFTVDGFFGNGDVQLRDKNGGVIRMTKDEALEMMQATEDKRINQDLADEQAAYKEAERVRQEEEKARLEAQRKFEEERRGKIAEIQKTVVDEAAARPQPTEQNEEATKWNGLAIADIADAEGVRKYLLDNYESEADADTFMNEQRRILRTHQRDDIQPEIDNITKQLDDYITGKTELSDEELTGLITQLSEWETEQNRLNGVADALKNISDALPKTYAERNAEVLKNASPYEQRMAELSKAKTNEDKVRIAKKLYGNDPDVGTLFDDLDVPADATELVSMFLKPRVLRWEGVDQGGVHLRGVEDELGKHMKRGVGRNVDSNNINTFLAAKGEGKTVDEFVHDIWESPENHPVGAEEKRFDDTEIRNALINLLLSAKNPTEIRDLIIDGRIAEAERILKEVQDREEEYGRRELADAYHISPTEVESYEDYVLRNAEEFYLNDEEYQEINSIFAEQNELRNEQDRRSQEMDRQPIVAGAGGEGEGSQAEVQRQGAEVHATEDQGKPVNGEGENLTDGTAVPGSDVAGGEQGEFERSIDELGRIEEEWNDKILDYVSQHYPTQAVVSAQTNSPKGKAERKAMLEDPVYQEMVRQQKEALDAADKKVTEAYKKEEEEKQANKPKTEESKKEDNDRGNQSSIQGIEGYDADEVLNAVRGDIEMKLEDAGIDGVTIKGLALNGSRMRGDAREDSDLDVVVEYEGNISEDGLFNILNENPTTIEGITVDINPITKGKSGTLEEYMKRSQKYDEEKKEKVVFKDRLAAAIEETNTKPTEGQKEAGNYKKGHLQFGGYNFTVENPKGSVRSGKDASGKPWSITMHNTYGYLTGKGHLGKDGDHLDVFINDDADLDNWNGTVFVVDQVNSDGSFDEHKIMYGFDNEVDALRNYLMNYSRPWHGMGNITGVDKATFDKWVESSNRKQKPFAETRFGDNRDVVEKVMDGIEKKKEVADLREPDQSDAVTEVSKPQTSNQNGRKSINAETQTSSSEGKDKKNIDTLQEKGNKNAKKNENKIEDVGEVIAGARKDMRRKIAESIESATEKTLIDLPFSKAYKKPDLKKAVEEGALREEDATFYDAFFSTMVNPSKPKVVQSELRMKKWKPDYKTKVERWAEATHEALQVLKEFVEATEEQRDEIIRKALENKYPMRDVELAEIEKRKQWNKDRDFKAGDKTTPNPLWVTYEVMKQLDYKPGEKLDIPYGLLKADAHGTGYYLYNAKNETNYNFHPQSVEDGISDIVWLAKLKRGDTDIQHPISSFSTPATKSETGETGRYRVIWGGSNIKTRDFDNKKDADEFAASRKQQSLVSPIREVVRRFGYKVVFRNPLTNDKIVVDDQEFDTKDEAQAYLEDNYDELNEKLNNILSEQRKDKKKTELKADDLVYVSMVRGNDNKWTYGVVMDKKYANYYGMPRILKEGFAIRAEAKDYADSIKDEVLSTYKNYKTKQKNIVYFDTGENSRLGEDYRGGKDVSAEDFMNTFGFRGVQFGNWTNQADRQMAVNQAYDAFLDLAKLIGVSPQALSLNGELGIAFGARGAGGFAAHYEPGEIVINLTKTQGAGSLAHEWWHALDNYFARAAGEKGGMVTDDSRLEMRPELRDAYNTLTRQVASSKYFARSKAKGDYWGRMHEVTARLLAEWVDQELKKRGELNTFLSRGVNTERTMENNYLFYEVMQKIAGKEVMPFEEFKKTDEAMSGSPYPSKAEVDSFADAMRNIFDVMEERVDEETGNVMLHESDAPYNEAQEAMVIDMPQVRLEKLKEEYQKLDDMMRDDQGRDFDEQEETLRTNYIKNNGRKGLGEVVSKFLNDAIEKYGEKALTRRWDLQDEIADLESKMAKERSARRKNPKVVSHVEGNLFPEEKEGELFDDNKAAAKPQPTKKPESKLEKLSDKQLLEGIGQNANSKDWDLYIDEYDKRHRDEYQDALAAYSDMLEKENVSLEDAYGMYADVAAKWNDKGFASDERSKLMAQVDALEEYVDRLESEAIEREEAEEEEAAAKQQPAEKKAKFEQDKTDVRAHGYDLTKIRLRELGEGEVSHVERRYVENGTFSFTGGEHIESAADVAYIFRQLEDAAVENSFMVLIKDGVPTVIHLAIGSYNAVHAPIEQAFAAYKEIDPDNVIFLHNHPSGNLVASREDLALQRKVEAMFGRKALPGIIINTKSGKYAEFNSEGSNQIGLRPKSVDKDIPVRVFNFSKQVFAKDWNPETAFEGSDSRSMAAFVSSHRLGDHNKMSLIVMDQAGHITGNIFLPWTTTNEISKQANALQIATYVNQMGGRYALIYGNTTVTDSKDIKILKTNLDGYNVKLRDVMTIEGSAHDKGLLFEPDVEYKGDAKEMMEATSKEPEATQWTLSDKKMQNGEQFYQDANGNIDLVDIPKEVFDEIGYTKAPLRLTPSMLKHVQKQHGKETKIGNDQEAIRFITDVMRNFDHVRLGNDGALVFSVENGRQKTGKRAITILLNSDNGEFYGIKTSGYESVDRLSKRPLLWEGSAVVTPSSDTATEPVTSLDAQQGGEQSGSASGQSGLSESKDTKNSDTLQEKPQKYDLEVADPDVAMDPGVERSGSWRGRPRQKKGEGMASYFNRLREWEQRRQVEDEASDNGIMKPTRENFTTKAHDQWAKDHAEWERNPDGKPEPVEWDYDSRAEKEYQSALSEYEKKIDERMPTQSEELTSGDLSVERESQVSTPGQRYVKDIADIMSREYDHSTASDAVKSTVINRRKDIEELAAADSITIKGVKDETNRIADSIMEGMGITGKRLSGVRALEMLSDGEYQSQMTGRDVRRAMTYLIEKPMRLRDIASGMNSILESKHSPVRVTADDLMRAEDEINALRSDGEKLLDIRKRMEEENRDRMTMDELVTLRNVKDKAETVVRKMNNARGMTADDIMATLSEVVKRVVPDDLKIKEISPEMQGVMNTVKDWYNIFYDWLDEAGMRPDNVGYYKDYVNHVWDKERSDPEAYERYVANRQPTKSRNMRTREIRTLMDGIDLGLVPKYDDVADLMGDYSKSNILAWSNKKMLVDLSGIDIVERDSNGEASSILPMLTNRVPDSFSLNKYDYFEIPGVGPVWVHKGVSKNFSLVFGTYEPGKIWRVLDNLASIAKNIELAWSGFHGLALSEVYAMQNVLRPKRAAENFFNFMVKESLMQGQAPAYADPELYKEAASHLVKLGATADYSPETMKNLTRQLKDFFGNLADELNQKGVAGKTLSVAPRLAEVSSMCVKLINAGMDKALWTWLHDGLKLCQYKMLSEEIRFDLDRKYGINEYGSLRKTLKAEKEQAKEEFLKDDSGLSEADRVRNSAEYQRELNKALDEAGQYINDQFGGQHFEVIGICQKVLRWLRRIFLSPDWLISTTRHFLSLFGYGSLYNKASVRNFLKYYQGIAGRNAKKLGINSNLIEDWASNDVQAGRTQRVINAVACYGVGCMIVYPFLTNLIQAFLRKRDEEYEKQKEQEDPNYVSKYRLAYPDGMKGFEVDSLDLNPFNSFNVFGDYGMGSNALGKRSHMFAGRYSDGTEMYVRTGKQFREVPEMFENERGELAFPAPLLKRMMGKANPIIRTGLDVFNYYTRLDKSKLDEDLEDRWKEFVSDNSWLGRNIALPSLVGTSKFIGSYMPFWVPTQKNKEWKPVDMFLPSSKGFTPYKARIYFEEFIKAQDEEGIKDVFRSCAMNGMSNAQITAAFNSAQKAIESEQSDLRGLDGNALPDVVSAFDSSTDLKQRKELKNRIDKIMRAEAMLPQDVNEFMAGIEAKLNGEDERVTKAAEKYLMVATSEDLLEDARLRQLKRTATERYNTLRDMRADKADKELMDSYARENKKWFDVLEVIKEGESGSKTKVKKGTGWYRNQLKGDPKQDAEMMEKLRKRRKEAYDEVMDLLK